jgi:DNA-binding CsgD family transcriptional regulator
LQGHLEKVAEEASAAFDLAVRHQHHWLTGELAYWRWKAGDLTPPPAWIAKPFALQISGNWTQAADEWSRLGCPYEAARALAESDDEESLKCALESFERLGARAAAVMTARRLRDLGARGIPRGPRPATRANPANLTQREIKVLELMAEGLRNAEIAERLYLSRKTVDHHVSSILSKLGVGSRVGAAREAARLEITVQSR